MLLIFAELMLVIALALFFSTFSSPMLSAALTFGLYVVGHFSGDLRNFQQVVDSPVAAAFARGLYWVLPNLAQFDIKSDVVHGVAVPVGYIALTAFYAATYIAMLLAIASLVFSRRDFK
jgi:ABC-type transport system involved in multi-copper enzyme maturation permease subunit